MYGSYILEKLLETDLVNFRLKKLKRRIYKTLFYISLSCEMTPLIYVCVCVSVQWTVYICKYDCTYVCNFKIRDVLVCSFYSPLSCFYPVPSGESNVWNIRLVLFLVEFLGSANFLSYLGIIYFDCISSWLFTFLSISIELPSKFSFDLEPLLHF